MFNNEESGFTCVVFTLYFSLVAGYYTGKPKFFTR
jgi:hypothetical protein